VQDMFSRPPARRSASEEARNKKALQITHCSGSWCHGAIVIQGQQSAGDLESVSGSPCQECERRRSYGTHSHLHIVVLDRTSQQIWTEHCRYFLREWNSKICNGTLATKLAQDIESICMYEKEPRSVDLVSDGQLGQS
jgi:hypothetical protein